jgi:hypothetical protein
MQLSVQVKGAQLKRQGLENLRREIPIIGKARIYEVLMRAKRRLMNPAPPPHYPIQWKSEKQRRYVMALLRKMGGGPYVRKGGYELGWQVITSQTAGNVKAGYTLVNKWGAAQFVGGNAYGQFQQPFHAGRWPVMRTVVGEEVMRLPKSIEDNIVMVAKREGL